MRHVGRLVFPLSLDPGTSPACATELPILQGDNDVVGAHILFPNPLHQFHHSALAGGRVGAVARHLLRVQGVQAGEPDRQARNGDG